MNTQADTKVEPLTGSSAPGAPDAASVAFGDDVELIAAATEVMQIAIAEDAAWAADPDRAEDHPSQILWTKQAHLLSRDLEARAEHLSGFVASTPAGVAAKASALLAIKGWHTSTPHAYETALIISVLQDAIRIGAPLPDAMKMGHICTTEEAAEIDFTPWDADKAQMLNKEEWESELSVKGTNAVNLRIAYTLLIKTKPELMKVVRDLNDGVAGISTEDMYDLLQDTARFLRCLYNYAHTASLRLLIAASSVVHEEHQAQQDAA